MQCHTAWITNDFYRCSTRTHNYLARVVLQQSKYTNFVELCSTAEIVALDASSTKNYSVQASCRHLYKVKSTKMPAYLHSLLSERVPTRTLRSSSRPFLDVTRIKTLYGQHSTSFPHLGTKHFRTVFQWTFNWHAA